MQMKDFKYLDNLIHSGFAEIMLKSDIILAEGEESIYGEGIKEEFFGWPKGTPVYKIEEWFDKKKRGESTRK